MKSIEELLKEYSEAKTAPENMSKMEPSQLEEIKSLQPDKVENTQEIVDNPYTDSKKESDKLNNLASKENVGDTPLSIEELGNLEKRNPASKIPSPKELGKQKSRGSDILLKELDKLREEREGAQSKDAWLQLAKGLLDASAYYSAANPYSSKNKVMKTEMPTDIGSKQLETRRKELMDLLARTQASEDRAEDRLFRQGQMDLSRLKLEEAKKTRQAKSKDDSVFEKEFLKKKASDAVKTISTMADTKKNTQQNIKDAEDLIKAIEKGDLGTGPASGSGIYRAVESTLGTKSGQLKEQLDSLSTRAARAALKAAGESRPTDQDVQIMKRSMFGPDLTEETNVKRLKQFIDSEKDRLKELNNLQKAEKEGNLEGYIRSGSNETLKSKEVMRKQYSPSRNKTKITYSDGSTEVVDGKR